MDDFIRQARQAQIKAFRDFVKQEFEPLGAYSVSYGRDSAWFSVDLADYGLSFIFDDYCWLCCNEFNMACTGKTPQEALENLRKAEKDPQGYARGLYLCKGVDLLNKFLL